MYISKLKPYKIPSRVVTIAYVTIAYVLTGVTSNL
jgi:hypothetical protein